MTDSVNVEQCDRDAAQSFADDNTLCGCDKCIPVYATAFARHRIAERERCAGIAENVTLPPEYIWSEGNISKFKFGGERAAQALREHKP